MVAPVGGAKGWALRSAREVLTEIAVKVNDPELSDAALRAWLGPMLVKAMATQERWRNQD